ncbi:MAG: M48 family metallopeptidase [Candidatus Methylumidiphilus sp.]
MDNAPVQIRRSHKAKRLRLAVKPGLIELVVPMAAKEAQALAFLAQHRPWAEAKLAELNGKAALLAAPRFTANASLPWRGRELPLTVQEAAGHKIRVAVDEQVHITLPAGLGEARDELALRAFHDWTRHWLRGQVAWLAERHAPRHGLHPRAIRIKHMTTRWGSCGPKGDININWLLALAPESALEYVVVHELCHIRVRNHSPTFWNLVAEHLPHYAQERRWIKTHGAGLLRRFAL